MRVINDTMNWVRVRTGADVHDGSFRGEGGDRCPEGRCLCGWGKCPAVAERTEHCYGAYNTDADLMHPKAQRD